MTTLNISNLKKENTYYKSKLKDPSVAAPLKAIYSRDLASNEALIRGIKLENKIAKAGFTLDEWWKWAQSLYSVTDGEDGTKLVQSRAKNWEEDKVWEVDSLLSAQEKIAQLIGYKIQDRERGKASGKNDLLLPWIRGEL